MYVYLKRSFNFVQAYGHGTYIYLSRDVKITVTDQITKFSVRTLHRIVPARLHPRSHPLVTL